MHRVGRTARAGRGGSSLTFVTQYDVDLILAIEEYTGTKIEKSTDIDDNVDDNVDGFVRAKPSILTRIFFYYRSDG